MNFSFFFKSYSRISRLSESHLLLRYDRQIEYFLNFYIGKGKGKGDIYITYIYRPSSKKEILNVAQRKGLISQRLFELFQHRR